MACGLKLEAISHKSAESLRTHCTDTLRKTSETPPNAPSRCFRAAFASLRNTLPKCFRGAFITLRPLENCPVIHSDAGDLQMLQSSANLINGHHHHHHELSACRRIQQHVYV